MIDQGIVEKVNELNSYSLDSICTVAEFENFPFEFISDKDEYFRFREAVQRGVEDEELIDSFGEDVRKITAYFWYDFEFDKVLNMPTY
ncbi:hypothetical protein CL618_03555 [archaeon]|nr:hypothetical protein [archaeon]